MAFDLEEQEQLDEFKAWWNKNGKMVTRGVIAVLLAYAAWQGYQSWINNKAAQASSAYQNLVTLEITNTDEIAKQSQALVEDFKMTPYAGRAAIYAARALHQANKDDDAKAKLTWAASNAKEEAIKHLASIELAALQIDKKAYDEAKKTLDGINDEGFNGLKQVLLGDIYIAQNNTDDAKKAYTAALKDLDPQGKIYYLTQHKLEALGA